MSDKDQEQRAPRIRTARSKHLRANSKALYDQLQRGMPHTWVTYALIASQIVLFAIMVATGVPLFRPGAEHLLPWGADYGPLTMSGEWWRMLAGGFVHIGLLHLAVNMWCLWKFGALCERLMGRAGFSTIYLFTGLTSSLASLAWNPELVSAGASGALFGIVGALMAGSGILAKRHPASLFEDLRSSIAVLVIYSCAYGINQNTDHAAHLGGLVGGYFAARCLCRNHADDTPRVPWLRIDYRFLAALAVTLAAGFVAVRQRVTSSAGHLLLVAQMELAQAAAAGRHEAALAAATKLVDLQPDNAAWHGYRAYHAGELDQNAEALQAIDRAVGLQPKEAAYHADRAWRLAKLSQHEQSLAAAKRAVQLDPSLAEARHRLLEALAELGRFEDLLREAEALAALDDNDAMAHAQRSFALSNLDKPELALSAIEKALALNPRDPWSLEHAAYLREVLGKGK